MRIHFFEQLIRVGMPSSRHPSVYIPFSQKSECDFAFEIPHIILVFVMKLLLPLVSSSSQTQTITTLRISLAAQRTNRRITLTSQIKDISC